MEAIDWNILPLQPCHCPIRKENSEFLVSCLVPHTVYIITAATHIGLRLPLAADISIKFCSRKRLSRTISHLLLVDSCLTSQSSCILILCWDKISKLSQRLAEYTFSFRTASFGIKKESFKRFIKKNLFSVFVLKKFSNAVYPTITIFIVWHLQHKVHFDSNVCFITLLPQYFISFLRASRF